MRIGAAGPGDEPNAIGAAMSAASAAEEPQPRHSLSPLAAPESALPSWWVRIFHQLARNTIHEHPQRDTRDQ